jgi:hypothetical protein
MQWQRQKGAGRGARPPLIIEGKQITWKNQRQRKFYQKKKKTTIIKNYIYLSILRKL